ncbi:HNH endonuclease [Spirosoma sp. HMF4905]|uniref:HNH endonuclease n=1 Tax=Spirosoma arboris TaxID=2682092 RepID=A0A7K1S4T0_9BACT|nr:HNH endonuclease signature motif containing protein [Spirosoma arboris]MVM28598.1 HNH endonuclease [Spirosoma arboris]
MSRYIPEVLRDLVAQRAKFCCEYCCLPADRSFFAFHIDHVVSMKHGGETAADNLAFACSICNLNKGSDVATFLDDNDQSVRFYNPRRDLWREHFRAELTGLLIAKTDIGRATIKILNLNHPDSIIERRELIRLGLLMIEQDSN